MGQLYVNAGSGMLGAPSDSALHDASVLVRCVSTFTHREHLRLVLNLLIILQYLLRLPKAYYARLSNTRHNRVTGALQFTQPDTQFEKRMQILQHITNEENLEVRQHTAERSAEIGRVHSRAIRSSLLTLFAFSFCFSSRSVCVGGGCSLCDGGGGSH